MYIKKTIFNKYWKILKHDKNDKTHTQEDMGMYYSLFKDETDEVFILAVKNMLTSLSYFPRVDEMKNAIEKARIELNQKAVIPQKQEEITDEEFEKFKIEFKKWLEERGLLD